MTTIVHYTTNDDEDAHRYTVTVDGDYDLDDDTWNDSIAEQCADDWHSNYDGWEASWPRVLLGDLRLSARRCRSSTRRPPRMTPNV